MCNFFVGCQFENVREGGQDRIRRIDRMDRIR
jgi:hypothetical protein